MNARTKPTIYYHTQEIT